MGRLVERADYTARLLDVHYHNLIQHHPTESSRLASHLMEVMGSPRAQYSVSIDDAVNHVGFDPTFAGSISDAIFQLSENAKGVRDTIPGELFEAIYATAGELRSTLDSVYAPARHEIFHWVRNRCMLIHGIIDEAMGRDDVYHFLNIGRCVERIDMTARMVAVRCGMDDELPGWVTMLRSSGAFEMFMRSRGGMQDTADIIDFLLRELQFPRSILSSASSALASAHALVHGNDPVESEADPRFALGRLCAEIEFTSITKVHDDLLGAVAQLHDGVKAINASMTKMYFHHSDAIEWRQ